jgi:hypothetical protein
LQDLITNLNGVPLSEMFENFLFQFETFDSSVPFSQNGIVQYPFMKLSPNSLSP